MNKQGLVATVRALRRVKAHLVNPGRVSFGPETIVGPSLSVARGARLKTGSNVGLGTSLIVMANVYIGDDSLISSAVGFIGNDHPFDDPKTLIREQQGNLLSTIHLEGDNLVGYGSTIIGNIRIGQGAVIGAGSLVTRDVPPGWVVAGRPAKPLRRRGERCGGGDFDEVR